MRIFVAEPEGFSTQAEKILSSSATVELRRPLASELPKIFSEFDIFWFRLGFQLNSTLLESAKSLKIIATPVTGLDRVDLKVCSEKNIRVLSLKGETAFLQNIRATAEHTVALMLALLRRIPAAHADVLEGRWRRDEFLGQELSGKTLGIIGLGRIGRQVAELAKAFGMRVISADPDLDVLLENSDLISLHASLDHPSGFSNQKILGEREFARMKPSAFFINTARGQLVDEAALLCALESGRIAGAALDVLEYEFQVSKAHPLIQYARTHSNLILSPHLGGKTRESIEATEVFLAEKVVETLRRFYQ